MEIRKDQNQWRAGNRLLMPNWKYKIVSPVSQAPKDNVLGICWPIQSQLYTDPFAKPPQITKQ